MNIPSSTEKIFLHWILNNPSNFDKVPLHYFSNTAVQFVYGIIRNYFLKNKNNQVPSISKIVELVRLEDVDETTISNAILKTILNVDIHDYEDSQDDNWLNSTFKAWCIEKKLNDSILLSIDKIRQLSTENLNYDKIQEVAIEIKRIIGDDLDISFDDDAVGLDFDDPESHKQETSKNKVPTGWSNLDSILNGGWDRKTLNVFMGASGTGKSLWMCNMAVNMANFGFNVLYITLEMSDRKVMKRMSSTRLSIPIHEFDELSKDSFYIKDKLNKFHNTHTGGGIDLFDKKVGKIIVREFPISSATIYDIEAIQKKVEEKKKIKIDVIVIDYLTIMKVVAANNNMYLEGKQLSEGARALAQKTNAVVLTPIQIDKNAFDKLELTTKDISYSKAILETADNLFAIIRLPEKDKYYLQALKLRDGEFKWNKSLYTLETKYLKLIENNIIS